MWCHPHCSTYRKQHNLYLRPDLLNQSGALCAMPSLSSKSPLQCPGSMNPKCYLVKKKRISNWLCIKFLEADVFQVKIKVSGIWIILPLMEKCSRWTSPSELCSQRHLFLNVLTTGFWWGIGGTKMIFSLISMAKESSTRLQQIF